MRHFVPVIPGGMTIETGASSPLRDACTVQGEPQIHASGAPAAVPPKGQ